MSHHREAHLGLCSAKASQQETRMPEDAVLQRGKRMFHCRSPQPHDFRRGALIHALQRGFVQVPCHEAPGTSCTATLEGAGSADHGKEYVVEKHAVRFVTTGRDL